MSQVIFLVNEYPGVLDLSAVNDVQGKRVMLQPKGYKGSERECFAAVEEHPHVVLFKKAGRLSIREGNLKAPDAPPPAPAPEKVPPFKNPVVPVGAKLPPNPMPAVTPVITSPPTPEPAVTPAPDAPTPAAAPAAEAPAPIVAPAKASSKPSRT